MAARAGAIMAAFALAALAATAALFASVVVTAALSQSMSAREAGDALVWMAAIQLLGIAAVVGVFRWLARRWSGAAPPWWSQGLLGVGLLCVAALLFVFAMVAMDR